MGHRQMTTTDRQKETASTYVGLRQVTPLIQQAPFLSAFQRPFETQQWLTCSGTRALQVSTDLARKRMRRIHNAAEREIGLQFRRDGFRPLKSSNVDLIEIEFCVGACRCSRDNAHGHSPTMTFQSCGKLRTFPRSSQKPDSVLAKAATLHQDDPRKR